MKPANELLESQRIALGLSESATAEAAGLSVSAYMDLEAYADEFWMTLSLRMAKNVCQVLGLQLVDVIAECTSPPCNAEGARELYTQDLADLRIRNGLSQEQLADIVGYGPSTIKAIEDNPDVLFDCFPITDAIVYAKEIHLDLPRLIRSRLQT